VSVLETLLQASRVGYSSTLVVHPRTLLFEWEVTEVESDEGVWT
jgi:hypothetical protein